MFILIFTNTSPLPPSHPHTLTPSQSPQSLHSVVLFDTLASDYRLLGVWLTSGGQQRSLGGAKPMEGEGFQINVKLNPSDKILVKVRSCRSYVHVHVMYMLCTCTCSVYYVHI